MLQDQNIFLNMKHIHRGIMVWRWLYCFSAGSDGAPECQQHRMFLGSLLYHMVSVFGKPRPSLQRLAASLSQHALPRAWRLPAQQVSRWCSSSRCSPSRCFCVHQLCFSRSLHSLSTRFGTVAVPNILLFQGAKPMARFNQTDRTLETLTSFITNQTGVTFMMQRRFIQKHSCAACPVYVL